MEDGGMERETPASTSRDGASAPADAAGPGHTQAMPWWGARHSMCLMLWSGLLVVYMTRVCLSIAIVAMVGTTAPDNTTSNDTCPPTNHSQDNVVLEGEFDWDEQTQGIILGSFFYGYTLTNFVGGRASEYLGGRLVFGVGVVLPSILTLLTPVCAHTSAGLLIALRTAEGLVQAVTFPTMHTLLAVWIPPKDKAKLHSFVQTGVQLGTILAFTVGGWLCDQEWLGGWPAVFYVFGAAGTVWGLPWFLWARDSPETHPTIVPAELHYITSQRTYVQRGKVTPLPWRALATSVPFWTLIIMSYGYNYGFYITLTELPTYLKNVQHVDINRNGLMSSLPYLMQGVTNMVWGYLMTSLTASNHLSIIAVRKLSTGIGMFVSAAAFTVMLWVECSTVAAGLVMSVAVGVLGCMNSGSVLGEQDIAPNLAGSLKGITNTVGAATGFLAPAITGAIINNNQTLTAWSWAFMVAALTNVVCALVYMVWATDQVQPWNQLQTDQNK